jgi:hypothetical protein
MSASETVTIVTLEFLFITAGFMWLNLRLIRNRPRWERKRWERLPGQRVAQCTAFSSNHLRLGRSGGAIHGLHRSPGNLRLPVHHHSRILHYYLVRLETPVAAESERYETT